METKTVTIPNINCGHCVNTVQMEVGELSGVSEVNASAESKEVTITWQNPATWQTIESLLIEIDYPPTND